MTKPNKEYEELYVKYNLAMRRLEAELSNLVEAYEFNTKEEVVDHTKSRVKKFDSAVKKMKSRGIEVSPENMEEYLCDMVGVRIVCPFTSNVYDVVSLIKACSSVEIIEEMDYIKDPKESGYKSYHLDVLVPVEFIKDQEPIMVKAEIQVRSMAMDLWATLDHKLRYKLSVDIQEELKSEFLARAKDMDRFDSRMQSLKDEVNDMKIDELEKPKKYVKKS